MRNYSEILKKLKRLANDKTFVGESDTAEEFIKKIKEKYNIEDSEILWEEEPTSRHEFKYDGSWLEWKLLVQIISIVTWNRSKGIYYVPRNKNNKHLISYCTEPEAFEISAMFEFYKAKMFEDVQVLFRAFIEEHDLFPQLSEEDLKSIDSKPIDSDKVYKAALMRHGLSKGNYTSRKTIEYDEKG